jgi:hypothetical protein
MNGEVLATMELTDVVTGLAVSGRTVVVAGGEGLYGLNPLTHQDLGCAGPAGRA